MFPSREKRPQIPNSVSPHAMHWEKGACCNYTRGAIIQHQMPSSKPQHVEVSPRNDHRRCDMNPDGIGGIEMTDRRCFLQWFVLLLSYAAAAFFASYYGLLQAIWQTDVTYM